MTENYSIRSLDNTFCDEIVHLILPIQQIEFNVPVTLEGQPDLLNIESQYHQSGGDFWGAVYNDQLIGTIALIATGHNAGAIRKMFVKKEFRGKELGVAQQLFETLVDYCRKNNIADLYLGTVDMLHAAHRFYERNGFQRINKKELPHYFPRMEADNIYYYLHLDNY